MCPSTIHVLSTIFAPSHRRNSKKQQPASTATNNKHSTQHPTQQPTCNYFQQNTVCLTLFFGRMHTVAHHESDMRLSPLMRFVRCRLCEWLTFCLYLWGLLAGNTTKISCIFGQLPHWTTATHGVTTGCVAMIDDCQCQFGCRSNGTGRPPERSDRDLSRPPSGVFAIFENDRKVRVVESDVFTSRVFGMCRAVMWLLRGCLLMGDPFAEGNIWTP